MSKIASLFAAALVLLAANVGRGQNFWEPVGGPYFDWATSIVVDSSGAIIAATMSGICRSSDDGKTWKTENAGLPGMPANGYYGDLLIDKQYRIYYGTRIGFFLSTDEGTTWQRANTGLTDTVVTCMTMDSSGKILAVADSGAVFSYSLNRWTRLGMVPSHYFDFTGVLVNRQGQLFVSSDSGLFRSEDSGHSWTRLDIPPPVIWDFCLAIDSNGSIYAGSYYGGGLWISTTDGATWKLFADSGGQVTTIVITSNGKLFYGGTQVRFNYSNNQLFETSFDGIVKRATDNGASWVQIHVDLTEDECLFAGNNGIILAGTSNTGIFISRNSGDTWEPIDSGIGIPWAEVDAAFIDSKENFFAVVDGSNVYSSSDSGHFWSWTNFSPGYGSGNVSGFVEGKNGDLFLAFADSGIYRSQDEGKSWLRVYPYRTSSFAVAPDGSIYAGSGEGIIRSTDNLDSWITFKVGVAAAGLVAIDSMGDIFAVASDGIYRSTNEGADWLRVGLNSVNYGLTIGKAGQVFAIALDTISGKRSLFESVDLGGSWNNIADLDNGQRISSFITSSDGRLFVGGISILRSIISTSSVKEDNDDNTSLPNIIQNSPNPFTQSTIISFTLPAAAYITLALFDATGREVRRIASGYFGAGAHEVAFARGNLPAGVYFYRLEANGSSQTRAMVVLEP